MKRLLAIAILMLMSVAAVGQAPPPPPPTLPTGTQRHFGALETMNRWLEPQIFQDVDVLGMLTCHGNPCPSTVFDLSAYLESATAATLYEPKNANIQAHIASTDNPHSTTAAQVGAVPTSRTITAGTGLSGGGDLSANRTISLASNSTSVNGQTCALGGSCTISSIGNASTANALAANGTNCSSGQAALGVDVQGNAEGCFAVAPATQPHELHYDTPLTAGTTTLADNFVRVVTFPTGLTGSFCTVTPAPSGSVVLSLRYDNVEFGTCTISTSATVGVLASTSGLVTAASAGSTAHYFWIVPPADLKGITSVSLTLVGTR